MIGDKTHFFKVVMVQMAPKRSMAPIPMSMGEVYLSNTKATKLKKTNILTCTVSLKNAVMFCTAIR